MGVGGADCPRGPYEIVHDRVLAYGWRRWLGGTGPLRAALGLAAQLTGGARFEYG
jgi:hypothetical protein